MSGTFDISKALEGISQEIRNGGINPLSDYAYFINQEPALKVTLYSHAAGCYADYIIRIVTEMPQILLGALSIVNSHENVPADRKTRILQEAAIKIL